MNDLAEKALHGLDVARRAMVARPMRSFAALGFLVAAVVVVAGGQVNAQQPTRPLTGWFGLQSSHGVRNGHWLPGAIMLAAIVALALLWLGVVRFVRRRDEPESQVWWVAGAWALPFVIGPPLLGTTVQTYVAFGLLQRHGHSPYDFAPARLGANAIVAAIEPAVRDTPSSAGPLGTVVQHLAVSISAGSALGGLLVLRGIAVVCTILIGRLAADLAGPSRARALSLTVLNPLVLLYLVSAARLDGLLLVFVLAALSAASQRRWLAAVALACLAGSVSGQGFLLVPAIIAVHLLGRRTVPVWLLLARDLLVAAVTTVVAALVAMDGFGWLWTVSKQFSAHPPFSVASAVAKVLTPIVRGASYDDLAAGARITVVSAMVSVVGYLVVTARQRALERTAGFALLALALLSPVMFPWYLLWGLVCLAAAATGGRRVAVLALSVVGCLLNPPGFSTTTTNVLSGVALVVTAVVLASLPSVRRATQPVITAGR
jgi:alpha-1,6-mannosyltransferase